ncbi:hypothetical protein HDU98_011656 [Podochytrium sp. JEL0797]|nr:hypothetical protein HDU98_011656 [Podochytrium sp. JEL0797]
MFCGPYYCFNNTALDFLMSKWYPGDTVTAGFAMSIPMISSTSLLTVCGSLLTANSTGFLIEFVSMLTVTCVHLTLGFSSVSPTIPFMVMGLVASINLTLTYPFLSHVVKREETRLAGAVKMLGLAYGVCVCCQNIALTLIPVGVAWILVGEGEGRWVVVQMFFAGLCAVGAVGAGWLWWNEAIE